ncbi:hypothetical protein HAX54_043313 [Datura stramonium]|uniref:Uncharacterized protein n=1 Tax=Datura stramonium TaxID=4076 RepID=A0ABS8W548_DATST|nr:hypothetical protein [Datura stramonium]
MENENDNLLNLFDFPMYDGMGNPRIHMKAYLDWLVSIGQENRLKIWPFVRMLTGPALMWGIRNGLLFPDYVPPYQDMGDNLLASRRLTVRPNMQRKTHGGDFLGTI